MTDAAEKLKPELIRLSAEDRAALAHFLIHSLDDAPASGPGAESAWDAELARRGEEIRSGQATGRPAHEVLAEMREKYA